MSFVIKQGQIWEVMEDGLFGDRGEWKKCPNCTQNYKVYFHDNIPVGKKIEIRCPMPWHIRTEDNMYYSCEPKNILKNCIPIGTMKEDVRWENRLTLKEILQQGLWDAFAV